MAGPALPGIIGGAGVAQNAIQGQQGKDYQRQAIAAMQPQVQAQKLLLNQAKGYNPAAVDMGAIGSANQEAGNLIHRDLGQLAGAWTSGGGSPTGDTAFGQAAQQTANRTLDPLREFESSLIASEPQRKAQMLQGVFSAPAGNIANTYFNAAANSAPTWGPSLGLLTQAFQKLSDKGAAKSGAGGVPDYAGTGVGDDWGAAVA